MADAISSIISGQPAYQPQQAAPAKPDVAQPKSDTVTISAQGKQAVQLRTAGSTPAEEAKETPIQRAVEATAGKK